MTPLLVILSLPLFTAEFPGDGSICAVQCLESTDGYFLALSERDDWGGNARCTLVWMDENGQTTLSYTLNGYLEPLAACDFAGKRVILCNDPSNYRTVLAVIGGAGAANIAFDGQFLGGASMHMNGDELVLAGNDETGDSHVRVVILDDEMQIVSNDLHTSVEIDVCDVTVRNGQTWILGSTEQPGWQRDITLFHPVISTVHHQPLPGRFTPVSLDAVEDGFLVTANAMTDGNGMVGEIFLMKLDGEMNIQWSTYFGGESWLSAAAAEPTGEGIALTGWTNDLPFSESNRSDLLLMELGSAGQILWSREYGGSKPDYGLGLSTCSDRGLLVSGCFVDGLYSGWVLRTDSTGSLETQGIEPPEPEPLMAVTVNPSREGTISLSLSEGFQGPVAVAVLDISGRTVRRAAAETGALVGFSGLPAGVYLITAESRGTRTTATAAVTGGGS